MKTINRHAIVLVTKPPFAKWIEKYVGLDDGRAAAVYLVDMDDSFTSDQEEALVRAHWEPLFRRMLGDYYTKHWPELTWDTFQAWCDAHVSAFVLDKGEGPITEIH